MKRFLSLWSLVVPLGLLAGGCDGTGAQNPIPEKTEIRPSGSENLTQAPDEEKSPWPAELQNSFRELQSLWVEEQSLALFFQRGEVVKTQLEPQLPIIMAELETDSPLTALREEMKPFPWWHVQAGPEGEKPVIFWDYGYLLEHARDSADRAFFQLCVDWFPTDSIEYFHPSWQLPMEDNLVFSMLGSGIHRYSFGRIREQLAQGSPYLSALSRMQRALIDDILRGKDYWYDVDLIISEIDSIRQHEARFFPKSPFDSLPQRKTAFQAADSLGLRVNWRAGG